MFGRLAMVSVLILGCAAARAGSFEDASRSAAFMAAATVCKAEITQDKRREMYAAILSIYNTPSQVNFVINQEISTLRGMPPAERDAMCSAINDRIKAEVR